MTFLSGVVRIMGAVAFPVMQSAGVGSVIDGVTQSQGNSPESAHQGDAQRKIAMMKVAEMNRKAELQRQVQSYSINQSSKN